MSNRKYNKHHGSRISVLLAAGGSGGHIFPAVALASELEKYGIDDIFFISSRRKLDRNILDGTKYKCFFLSVNPMPRKVGLRNAIVFFGKLAYDVLLSFFIILRTRPDVVTGFGGYSSGAAVAVARFMGMPVIIHEQNYFPGRANRILGKIVDRVAISFGGTEKYFTCEAGKVIYTGNPLRVDNLSKNRPESAENLGIDPNKFTILVMGGSQGASSLNRIVSLCAEQITLETDGKIQFIHLTGRKDFESIERFYRDNGIPGRVFAFLDRIDYAYASSDMAVTRAGAASIFELALYARPMILVPYPNPRNNQGTNALYFEESGAAVLKNEKDLTPSVLYNEIMDIFRDREKFSRMSTASAELAVPDAGRLLAEEVVKLSGKRFGTDKA